MKRMRVTIDLTGSSSDDGELSTEEIKDWNRKASNRKPKRQSIYNNPLYAWPSNSVVPIPFARTILECWLSWLCRYISVHEKSGDVQGYAEEFIPGWLLLQMGRHVWPHRGDIWIPEDECARYTSVSIINILRRESRGGYLIDSISWQRWRWVREHQEECWPEYKFNQLAYLADEETELRAPPNYHNLEEMSDWLAGPIQVLAAWQQQPGRNGLAWWIRQPTPEEQEALKINMWV
nr:hypothetical protein [Crucivirus sp.]